MVNMYDDYKHIHPSSNNLAHGNPVHRMKALAQKYPGHRMKYSYMYKEVYYSYRKTVGVSQKELTQQA